MQFSRFVAMLGDGEAHDQLTEILDRVTKAIRVRALADHTKVKGEITLKIKLVSDQKLVVDASYDVTFKEPKAPRPTAVLWLNHHGTITAEDPRQQKLPLRVVEPERGNVRDVVDTSAGVAEV